MDRLKRKKVDEEEQKRLSAVFEQYHDDFGEQSRRAPINKSFVRGEVVNADKNPSLPSLLPTGPPKAVNAEEARRLAAETARKIMLEAQQKKIASAIQLGGQAPSAAVSEKPAVPVNRPPKPGSKKDSKSNLEAFKQELKQMQEMRQERRGLREQLKQKFGDDTEAIDRLAPSLDNPYRLGSGEYADDPHTTNLYLFKPVSYCEFSAINSFLSFFWLQIEMKDLYETFGSFGPLASAKILYPRGEDDVRKGGLLSGFVAYMSRTDAERAMAVMNGVDIRGSQIRCAWARPVAVPPAPFFVPQALRELMLPDPPSGLPFNARPQPSDLRAFLEKHKQLPPIGPPAPSADGRRLQEGRRPPSSRTMLANAIVRVVIPTERPLLVLIHRVIEFLIREGPMFEALIMEQERMNPLYRFLFDNNHPTHVYYRWRLFSILNGEDRKEWRLERFRMFEGGSWWEPPPHSLCSNGMPPQLYARTFVPQKARQARLSRESSRSPTGDRKRSRRHSGGSNEDEEPRKRGVLARADRDHLQALLRDITPEKHSIGDAMLWCVEHADCAKAIVDAIYDALDDKEALLHKKIALFYLVSDILANCGVRVKDVFFFRSFFQENLERIFESLNRTLETIESRIKAEQFRQRVMLCFRMWEDNAIYPRDILIKSQNIFLGLIKPNQANDSDDEDLDGVPLNATNEEDDIDGIPMDQGPSQPPAASNSPYETAWNQNTLDQFTSKWERDVPETSDRPHNDGHSDGRRDSEGRNGDSHSTSVLPTAHEEERRRLLREVELKMVRYQDELEGQHAPNIEQKLADHRRLLIEKVDEQMENFDEGQLSDRNDSYRSSQRSSKRDRRSRSRSRSRDRGRYRDRSHDRSRDRSRERDSKRRRSRSRDSDHRKRSRRDDRSDYHRRDRSSERRR
ncbi:hypothetical protein M3Y99_01142800 [Aphelenchoides fujianensis]|nr:hypothetical protein M3Y99_01142800 [Aphelenchoides fujianensis]